MSKNNDFLISAEKERENICTIFLKKGLLKEKEKKIINKIDSFKYIKSTELDDQEGLYERIEIDFSKNLDLKEALIKFLLDVKKEFDLGNSSKNPLIRIINFWKINNNTNLIIEDLKGDIGEALLIYKFAKLGYYIKNNLRNEDHELYDFFFDKSIIEVKTTSIRSNEIKINDSQMINDPSNKDINIVVTKVKYLKKTLDNHKNILEIYKMINEIYPIKNDLLEFKKTKYETIDQQIIDNNSIDINDYSFSLMDYKKIIENKISKPSGLKDLIYVFDVSDLEKLSDQKLRELIIKND